ncbi:MAG: DNA polymerase III subunit beta [Geodermatophilaceae bacterium]|nr:DNA polymerase III subunit beta [Geodermatophilaceae bacterium]
MKFRVERDVLADTVAWTARSLPSRPPVPVLAGILLEVDGETLTVSGFDYEVSTRAQLPVHAQSAGRALVSGRLLADITKSLPPHPVEVAVDGARMTITGGAARFTLPMLPVEDYPTLPVMPTTSGVVLSGDFDTAVSQVAVAAGRDDTLPMLTGVRLEIDGDRITLAATDRYRLAVREFGWSPEQPGMSAAVLVPARSLADAAKTLTGGTDVTLALSSGTAGEGIMGFASASRTTTTRLLDAEFPQYRKLLPTESAASAEIRVASFIEAVKRVSLVAERGTPVRLSFDQDGLRLLAGGDDEGRAEEQMEAEFSGDPLTIGFNHQFLLDGLSAVRTETVRLAFTTPNKPAVLAGVPADGPGTDDYRYLIMPVRLPG